MPFLLPCGEDVLVALARFLLFVVKILEGKVLVQMLHGFSQDRVELQAGAKPRIAKRPQRLVQCNVVLHKFLCGFLAEVLELLNGAIDETFVRATSTESLNALVHQLIIVESIGVQFECGVRINFLGVRVVRKETATAYAQVTHACGMGEGVEGIASTFNMVLVHVLLQPLRSDFKGWAARHAIPPCATLRSLPPFHQTHWVSVLTHTIIRLEGKYVRNLSRRASVVSQCAFDCIHESAFRRGFGGIVLNQFGYSRLAQGRFWNPRKPCGHGFQYSLTHANLFGVFDGQRAVLLAVNFLGNDLCPCTYCVHVSTGD